ncbi:sigma-54-dependent transcriptional regulator, partial [Acidobacteriota bacterium]
GFSWKTSRHFQALPAEVVLLDVRLPDRSGLDLLPELLSHAPGTRIVMISGYQDMQATIQAVRVGAFDFIRKPLDLDEVMSAVERAFTGAADAAEGGLTIHDEQSGRREHELVGKDKAVIKVIKQIGLLSRSRVGVLIEGESGTGKELVARAIHEAGSPGRPFVAINCSSIVPSLLESELFGHEKGAFTGAEARKKGKLELAQDGSVFFDEIGDMSPVLQSKLLRALQEKEFERVGGIQTLALNGRIIAATNRDLHDMVEKGLFREDLYYRLSIAVLSLPPLRERKGDIPLLVTHLLNRINRDQERTITWVPDEVMKRFVGYAWPGNVRELYNVLVRAVTLSTGDRIDPAAIDLIQIGQGSESAGIQGGKGTIRTLKEMEKEHILKTLEHTDWNITRTSALLGISPPTLRKKIRDYKLRS